MASGWTDRNAIKAQVAKDGKRLLNRSNQTRQTPDRWHKVTRKPNRNTTAESGNNENKGDNLS